MRARTPAGALLAATLALAMSAPAAAGESPTRPPPKPRTYIVIMEATRFQPDSLTVKQGDFVLFVNRDFFPHTATSLGAQFDSREISAGASWKYTAKKAGAFAFFCKLHPTMKGTLRVTAAPPPPPPASQSPSPPAPGSTPTITRP